MKFQILMRLHASTFGIHSVKRSSKVFPNYFLMVLRGHLLFLIWVVQKHSMRFRSGTTTWYRHVRRESLLQLLVINATCLEILTTTRRLNSPKIIIATTWKYQPFQATTSKVCFRIWFRKCTRRWAVRKVQIVYQINKKMELVY